MLGKRAMVLLGSALLSVGALVAAGSTSAAVPPHSARLDQTLRVHPALQYGAQVEPDKKVRVLVQKVRPEHDAAAVAADVGASVDEEFGFVNTFVLEVPQKAVLKLAHNPHVRYVSPDGAVKTQATIDTSQLRTSYDFTTNAVQVWNSPNPAIQATGAGVSVAVLDTGRATHPDLGGGDWVLNLNKSASGSQDRHGHGEHVIGIIKGLNKNGYYIGVAPNARVVSVKISDDSGLTHESDLLRGLQWVFDNRAAQNIRVVNVSMSAATPQSYRTSPVDAAVEQLWLNGVTVVVAAGNRGSAADAVAYAPANDPYAITVGALDDAGTPDPSDDRLAVFSSRGTTQDGFYKPDVVAPGRRIVSLLAGNNVTLAQQLPGRITDKNYIRLSGTSMAAPVVSASIALILERHPGLLPNQIKWLLQQTGRTYPLQPDTAKAVDAAAMASFLTTNQPGLANQGLVPNSGIDPTTGTVLWGQAYWDNAFWDTAYWDNAYWDMSTSYD
jgi:serine protease AprX